jgi:hypothetical protein
MKSFALIALLAAAAAVCSAAFAKIDVTIHASTTHPHTGQRVTFLVDSGSDLKWNLRLIAVAPGQEMLHVVGTFTGDTSRPDPHVHRDGFEIHLRRLSANRWSGTGRFRRPGRWHVYVPNEAAVGVMLPNGAAHLALEVR